MSVLFIPFLNNHLRISILLEESSDSSRFLFIPLLSFFKINLFIYLFLFLAVFHLRFCARTFSSCSERGLLYVAVHGLLIVVASLVAEHGL